MRGLLPLLARLAEPAISDSLDDGDAPEVP